MAKIRLDETSSATYYSLGFEQFSSVVSLHNSSHDTTLTYDSSSSMVNNKELIDGDSTIPTNTTVPAASTSDTASTSTHMLAAETNRPGIAMLISSHENDVQMTIEMFKSLDQYVVEQSKAAPILLFNEGDLSPLQKDVLQNATARTLFFPVVDPFDDPLSSFPDGFDPVNETSLFAKRSKWGYQQMCRFWITHIWKHQEILSNYTTIMRMDTDSCFVSKPTYPVPNLRSTATVYKANPTKVILDPTKGLDSPKYTFGLLEFANDYLKENQLTPQNPYLWNLALTTEARASFFSNFEISRISFFQRPDVMKFQQAITESEPYGVFRYRWGDAVVRFLTLAIFATPSQVDLSTTRKYYAHGTSCPNIQPGKIKARRNKPHNLT